MKQEKEKISTNNTNNNDIDDSTTATSDSALLMQMDDKICDSDNNNNKNTIEYDSSKLVLISEKNKTTTTSRLIEDNLQFNLNFDTFDISSFLNNDDNTTHNRQEKKRKTKKLSSLDADLMRTLNESLVNITTGHKQYNDEKSDDVVVYHLLYFCSLLTASNLSLFESVRKFLQFMRARTNCQIRIVLISSDNLEDDYNRLIGRFRLKKKQEQDEDDDFDRLALDFKAKSKIKEKLFQQLHVMGIPWFSLINASNGQVLCENLKIFILNSQLREMIF